MKEKVRKRAGKILSVVTTVAVLSTCSVFGGGLVSGAEDSPFGGGSGTQSNPYLIKTADQLAALSGNSYNGIYFKLANDIDLSGINWTPIYYEDEEATDYGFEGTLDGNGYRVLHLNISESDFSNGNWFGLFDTIGPDGTVKNLGIEQSTISLTGPADEDTGDCYYAGSIAGQNDGTISGCYSTAALSAAGGNDVSGIADINSGTIENSYFAGTLTLPNPPSDSTFISASGGICSCNAGTITNCYSTGTQTVGNDNTDSSYAGIAGPVTGEALDGEEGVSVTGCYYLSDSSVNAGLADDNATAKAAADLKKQATFDGWDFSGVWHVNSACNNGYPYLLPFARTLTIHVTAASAGLKNATVTVGSASASTDAGGKASFSLLPGTYSYAVSLNGYTTVNGSATLADAGATADAALTGTGSPSSSSKEPDSSSKAPGPSTPNASGSSGTVGSPNTGVPGAAPLGMLAVLLVAAAAAIPAAKRLGK